MDLHLKIPYHMDGSKSGHFLMMHNMSPDGLWDCDEESMMTDIMAVSNDDLYEAYRATGEVTECSP
jgi:hypothetical protein